MAHATRASSAGSGVSGVSGVSGLLLPIEDAGAAPRAAGGGMKAVFAVAVVALLLAYCCCFCLSDFFDDAPFADELLLKALPPQNVHCWHLPAARDYQRLPACEIAMGT